MIVANLVVWTILGATPDGDVRDLVERLGSPRYAEREEAAAALERAGREARPVLVEALNSRDPEVRSRASALLAKIESDLMTRPTLVALDFEGRPLEEVVRILGERADIALSLEVNHLPGWTTRPITLVSPEPVPFWTAIDSLCREAGLQYNASSHGAGRGRAPVFRLMPGQLTSGPVSDSGPFRTSLLSAHFQRDVMLARHSAIITVPPGLGQGLIPADPAAGVAPVHEQFYVQMQLMAEPRLTIAQTHEMKLIEAVDELGQSLVPADAGQGQRFSAYSGFGAAPQIQMPIQLRRPERPGKVITLLRGVLPVTVSVRKPDPLIAPIGGDAVGKAVRSASASLTIEGVNPGANNQQMTIGLLVRGWDDSDSGNPMAAARGFQSSVPSSIQIEVLDEQGRVLPSILSPRALGQPDGAHMQLTILPSGEFGPPDQIRFYNLTQTTTEVAFEFHDIPIP